MEYVHVFTHPKTAQTAQLPAPCDAPPEVKWSPFQSILKRKGPSSALNPLTSLNSLNLIFFLVKYIKKIL